LKKTGKNYEIAQNSLGGKQFLKQVNSKKKTSQKEKRKSQESEIIEEKGRNRTINTTKLMGRLSGE